MDYLGLINVTARSDIQALLKASGGMDAFNKQMSTMLSKTAATPPMANAAAAALRGVGVAAADAARIAQSIRGVPGIGGQAAAGSTSALMQAQQRLAAAAQATGRVMNLAMTQPFTLARQAAVGAVNAVQSIGRALLANIQPANAMAAAIGRSRAAAIAVAGAVAGIGRAAASLAGAAAVGLTLFNVSAIKNAREFEAELAKINTIARAETPAALQALGDSLRQVAVQTGESLFDITDSYYDLLSAGLAVADAQEVLNQSLILAVGGIGDTKGAVDLMTSAWNAFKLNQDTAREAMDIFAASVERGKLRINDIGETFSTVAPLAFSLGIELTEIGAAYAAMTASGFTAGEAMTAMRSAMIGLQRQNTALQQATQATGVNFLALAREKGLQVAMAELRKYSEEAGVPLIKLLGRIEGVQFALASTGPNAEFFNKQLQYMIDAAEGGGVAMGLFERRMDSFDRVVKILQQSFLDLSIEWGTHLLPPLTRILQAVTGVIQGFTAWMRANRELAATFVPLVSALGAFVGLRVGLSALLAIIPGLSVAFTALGVGTGTALASIAAFAAPVLLVVAALAGLYLAIQNNVAGLGIFKDVLEPIGDAVSGVVEAIKTLASGGDVNFGATFRAAAENMGEALGLISEHLSEIGPAVSAGLQEIGQMIVQGILEFIPRVAQAAGQIFTDFHEWIAAAGPSIGAGMSELLKGIIDFIRNSVGTIAAAAGEWIRGFIAWIPTGIGLILDAIGGIIDAVVAFIGNGDNIAMIVQTLFEWAGAFIKWIPDAVGMLVAALPDIFFAILRFIAENGPKILIGLGNLLIGIGKGIVGGALSILDDLVEGLLNALVSPFKVVASLIIGVIRNIVGVIAEIPGPWQDAAREMKATLDGMQKDVDNWRVDITEDTTQASDDAAAAWSAGINNMGDETKKAVDTASNELGRAGGKSAAALGRGNAVTRAARDTFSVIPKEAQAASDEAVATLGQTPKEIADAIRGGYSEVKAGMEFLRNALKDPKSTTERLAELEGQLASKAMRRGLRSQDPVIRAEAEALQASIIQQMQTIETTAKQFGLHAGQNFTDAMTEQLQKSMQDPGITDVAAMRGQLTGEALRKGLRSKNNLIKLAAEDYKQYLTDALKAAEAKAHGYGAATGGAYAAGIRSRVNAVTRAAEALAKAGIGPIAAFSPPGPESPLHDIDKWGANTAEAYAMGMASGASKVTKASRLLADSAADTLRVTPEMEGRGVRQSVMFDRQQAKSGIPYGMEGRAVELLGDINHQLAVHGVLLGKSASRNPLAGGPLPGRTVVAAAKQQLRGAA